MFTKRSLGYVKMKKTLRKEDGYEDEIQRQI